MRSSLSARSLAPAIMHDIVEKTRGNLQRHHIGGEEFSFLPKLPKASVLIPLMVKDGQVFTLMTLRSQELRRNAGQVCFPGGKWEPGDRDEVDTALREAHEEVGLPPQDAQVVCRLSPVFAKGNLVVTPVVAFIDESFIPRRNQAEVAEVFHVPLDFFLGNKNHICLGGITGASGFKHSFHYEDIQSGNRYHIWGLTAFLAVLVATLALRKKPEFEIPYDPSAPLAFFKRALRQKLSKL